MKDAIEPIGESTPEHGETGIGVPCKYPLERGAPCSRCNRRSVSRDPGRDALRADINVRIAHDTNSAAIALLMP
jgi:hypothetical protein